MGFCHAKTHNTEITAVQTICINVINMKSTLPVFSGRNEIPASVFVKEPSSQPREGKEGSTLMKNKSLRKLCTQWTSRPMMNYPMTRRPLEDSAEEKMEESRAERIKRSSLRE